MNKTKKTRVQKTGDVQNTRNKNKNRQYTDICNLIGETKQETL